MTKRKSDKGFVAITVALGLLMLCGFVGLAIDLGFYRFMRRDMQNAADAGAIGAATAMANSENGTSMGRVDTALNGYTHGVNGVTVAVNNPPSKRRFAGNAGYVEVEVSQNQPAFFMSVFNVSDIPISARAVGYVQESGGGCVYILSPDAKLALTLTGGSTLNASCGVYVNSNHPDDGLNVGTGSCINAPSISVVGPAIDNQGCPEVDDVLAVNAVPQQDPLDHIPEPTPDDCSAHPTKVVAPKDTVTVLSPGTYCGGIEVAGTAHLLDGEYIMLGGGFKVKGGADAVSIGNEGITIFNTYDASHAEGQVDVTGGSSTSLKAATSGPRAGMLFMNDRRIISTKQNHVGGHSSASYEGSLYFPGVHLLFNGGSVVDAGAAYTTIVASTMEIGGGSVVNLGSNYVGLPGGENIIQVGILVE